MPSTNDTLLRAVAGVLLGWIALASVSAVLPRIMQSVLTPDDLFEPGRFVPSPLFIAITLTAALATAVIAGWLCRHVAISPRPIYVLASIVGILSFFAAIFAMTMPSGNPQPRTGNESLEIMQSQMMVQQPSWLKLAQPVLLTGGVLLGGRRRIQKA